MIHLRASSLDVERKVDYTVHMKEQSVRYSEQNEVPEGTMLAQEVPAPMVERANPM